MSSIISAGTLPQSFTPLSRLQSTLTSEVSTGAISSGDQSALSSALSDIDTSLNSQLSSAGSSPSPDTMKSKIDGLIAGEVSNGKLTSAQADELKTVFAKALQGGPGGPGMPSGGADKLTNDTADVNNDGVVTVAEQAAYDAKHPGSTKATTQSNVNSSSTNSNTSKSDTSKLLSEFLKLIQDSQSKFSNYSANGQSFISQVQSQIVNYQA